MVNQMCGQNTNLVNQGNHSFYNTLLWLLDTTLSPFQNNIDNYY
jgi:hypothetical protein